MMTRADWIKSRLMSFLKDTSATMTVEFVLIVPLLTLWFVGSFGFYDSFRSRNATQKGTYVVSDILARKETALTPRDIVGYSTLYNEMVSIKGNGGTGPDDIIGLRISSIKNEQPDINVDGTLLLHWSCSAGRAGPAYLQADIEGSAFRERIPLMAQDEYLIVFETFTRYAPFVALGWGAELTWVDFVVTKPRFVEQIDFVGAPSAAGRDDGAINPCPAGSIPTGFSSP